MCAKRHHRLKLSVQMFTDVLRENVDGENIYFNVALVKRICNALRWTSDTTRKVAKHRNFFIHMYNANKSFIDSCISKSNVVAKTGDVLIEAIRSGDLFKETAAAEEEDDLVCSDRKESVQESSDSSALHRAAHQITIQETATAKEEDELVCNDREGSVQESSDSSALHRAAHQITIQETAAAEEEDDLVCSDQEGSVQESSDSSALHRAAHKITIQEGKEMSRPSVIRTKKARATGAREVRPYGIPKKLQEKVMAAVHSAVAEEERLENKLNAWYVAVTMARRDYNKKLVAFRKTGKALGDQYFAAIRNSRGHSIYSQEEYIRKKHHILRLQREALPLQTAGTRYGRGGAQGRKHTRTQFYLDKTDHGSTSKVGHTQGDSSIVDYKRRRYARVETKATDEDAVKTPQGKELMDVKNLSPEAVKEILGIDISDNTPESVKLGEVKLRKTGRSIKTPNRFGFEIE